MEKSPSSLTDQAHQTTHYEQIMNALMQSFQQPPNQVTQSKRQSNDLPSDSAIDLSINRQIAAVITNKSRPSKVNRSAPLIAPSAYSTNHPVANLPENNQVTLLTYRGIQLASFKVEGRQLICLPQAFDRFLKHLVGGLHTVYTKLKRLDIVPVVCNVEQVRVLRGLGAIQPGVNRCKLIEPTEFDVLYGDCTSASARPGRPSKRLASSTSSGVNSRNQTSHNASGVIVMPSTTSSNLMVSGTRRPSISPPHTNYPNPPLTKQPRLIGRHSNNCQEGSDSTYILNLSTNWWLHNGGLGRIEGKFDSEDANNQTHHDDQAIQSQVNNSLVLVNPNPQSLSDPVNGNNSNNVIEIPSNFISPSHVLYSSTYSGMITSARSSPSGITGNRGTTAAGTPPDVSFCKSQNGISYPSDTQWNNLLPTLDPKRSYLLPAGGYWPTANGSSDSMSLLQTTSTPSIRTQTTTESVSTYSNSQSLEQHLRGLFHRMLQSYCTDHTLIADMQSVPNAAAAAIKQFDSLGESKSTNKLDLNVYSHEPHSAQSLPIEDQIRNSIDCDKTMNGNTSHSTIPVDTVDGTFNSEQLAQQARDGAFSVNESSDSGSSTVLSAGVQDIDGLGQDKNPFHLELDARRRLAVGWMLQDHANGYTT